MKKNFNLKREYLEIFAYFKNIQKYIYFIIGVFFIFALIGFFVPSPEIISKTILEYIENLLEITKDFGFWEMLGYIFLNNLKSSFFGWILGSIFGIFPIWGSLSNGYVLGFIAAGTVAKNGIPILWRLVPHGIFELPAIFISLGIGLKLGSCLFERKKKYVLFRENLIKSIKVFLLIILPLLIIAAIIESFFIFFI